MKLSKIILCAALTVLLASCNQGASKTSLNNNNVNNDGGGNTSQPVPTEFKELSPAEIKRECSPTEAQALKAQAEQIQSANASVDVAKGKKDEKAIAEAASAIRACDQILEQVVTAGACRVTKKNPVDPTKPSITYFDGYRIDQKCKKADKYLTAHNARPSKNAPPTEQPPVVVPVDPNPGGPVVVNPPVEPPPPVTGGPLRQCSADEFSKLSSSMSSVDLATKQIAQQGDSSNWKYDSDAIASASLGTKSCETLVAYHDQNPCERTVTAADGAKTRRQYTGASLRQRCEKARTYFYEFVQNKTTLNFKNADLFLDVSGFATKSFEADYINEIQGCRVENRSGHAIDYSGAGQVLVKDSRGFEAKMMVLETNEGLVIQCYGLNIDGPFSKREVVKVLREEGTNMPLSYRLK
jgi:hypothetical protein